MTFRDFVSGINICPQCVREFYALELKGEITVCPRCEEEKQPLVPTGQVLDDHLFPVNTGNDFFT